MTVVSALLRQRHNFYRVLLIVEVLALIGLRPLQQAPQLVSVVYLLIGGVPALLDSPLLPQNRLSPQLRNAVIPQKDHHHLQRAIRRRRWLQYGWLGAAGVEVLWQLSLLLLPVVAVQLSVLHVSVWLALMLYVLWTLMGALAEEPVFNGALLMGAAAGYLLIGFTGGIVLNSLLVLDPAAFSLSGTAHTNLPAAIGYAPEMLGAAFGSLGTFAVFIGFGIYLSVATSYQAIYGALASSVILSIVLFVASYVILLGAVVNAELKPAHPA